MEIKKIFSFVVVFAATFLTILNLVNEFYFMALSTSFLTIAFIICVSLSSDVNNIKSINIIMAVVLIIIFTYYAISGENEGFAILWILLVPILSIVIIGIKYGLILSTYFLLLLILIFYTPIRDLMPSAYAETFKTRFPVLYFVGLFMSIYVTIRNEKSKSETANALNYDRITGLPNRDIYDSIIKEIDLNNKYLFLIKIEGLNYVNNEFGHDTGNRLIKYAADYIRTIFSDKYAVYRVGDGLFSTIVEIDEDNLGKIKRQINNYSFKYKDSKVNSVSLLFGISSYKEIQSNSFKELEKIAFERLYQQYSK